MTDILEILKYFVLFCPFIVLIVSYFILKKLKMKQQYAVGFSADVTTLLLFFTVSFIVDVVWDYQIYIILIIAAIIIAIIFTFVEWRTKKEIEVPNLMRKIWRIYFVVLMFLYVVVSITAIIVFIIQNI